MARILIVDDDESIREFLLSVLEGEGYEVVATDDRQALQAAHASPPALVLLDLLMPTLTGYEICRQLRADPATATIPVIAMSANANLDALMAPEIFDDQLPKPFSLHMLADVVARWAAA